MRPRRPPTQGQPIFTDILIISPAGHKNLIFPFTLLSAFKGAFFLSSSKVSPHNIFMWMKFMIREIEIVR